jgi:acetyltransferase
MIEIKQLFDKEKNEALLFAKRVYLESKDESYTEMGIETFCSFVDNKQITVSFKIFGAFKDNVLKGIIATDEGKSHITLFFVEKLSQGKKIGKNLIQFILKNNKNSYITVNSSRYAVPIYKKLGFEKIDEEKEKDGIKFTPMKLVLKI